MIEAWTKDDLWPGGNRLLIVGPPGTGKTRAVLDHYVWPLLREGGRVLATSFTRAAAGELRERTGREFGAEPETWRESLTTIHSEAWRRCAGLGLERGKVKGAKGEDVDPDREEWLASLDARAEGDYQMGWDRVRHVWPEDIGQDPRVRLARLFRGAQLDEADAWVRKDMHGRYQDGKLVNPDFTGLLELALSSGCGRGVDLLAVDEAQDLSPLEWELIDLWAAGARRVLVVGDPDQAIYGWSGADGARLLRWIRSGDPARRLAQSWRVPRLTHSMARQVVRLVSNREDAPYEPADRFGEAAELNDVDAWGGVAKAQDSEQTALILSRTRAGCSEAVEGLLSAGVPHIAERGRQVLRRDSGVLRVADALSSWFLRSRAVSVESARLVVKAIDSRGPILEGRKRGPKGEAEKALKERDGDVSLAWMEASGFRVEDMARMWLEPDVEWWKAALLGRLVNAEALLIVRDWLAYYGTVGELMDAAARVVVTTAHGSKGREADLVVLDARKAIYLGPRQKQSAGELQTLTERRDEDLRCLYVAITRAKHRLVVIRGRRSGREDWLAMHGISVPRVIEDRANRANYARGADRAADGDHRTFGCTEGAISAKIPSSTESSKDSLGAISSPLGANDAIRTFSSTPPWEF